MCQKMGISEEFFYVYKAKIDEIHKAIPRIATIFYVLVVGAHFLLSGLRSVATGCWCF